MIQTIVKRFLALALSLALLLVILPTQVAAYAVSAQGLSTVTVGTHDYLTEQNGTIAYRYTGAQYVDLVGWYNGRWRSVCAAQTGFSTVLRQTGRVGVHFKATGNAEPVLNLPGVTGKVEVMHTEGGAALELRYTISNNSAAPVNYSLGSGSDMYVGAAYTPVVLSADGASLTMTSPTKNAAGESMQFELVTDGNCQIWCGRTNERLINLNTASQTNTAPGSNIAISYSWQDRTINPGETQSYAVTMRVNTVSSGPVVPPIIPPIIPPVPVPADDSEPISSNERFNNELFARIQGAQPGTAITMNAGTAEYVAEYVMRELRAASKVTATISLPGGKVLTLASGNLPAPEDGRIYWTLSELLRYGAQSFTNPDTGGIPAALLPDSVCR